MSAVVGIANTRWGNHYYWCDECYGALPNNHAPNIKDENRCKCDSHSIAICGGCGAYGKLGDVHTVYYPEENQHEECGEFV